MPKKKKRATNNRSQARSYHLRLHPKHVEWLDEQADLLQVNRSYFLDRLIGSIAEVERTHTNANRGSLFDEFTDQLVAIIEERVRKTTG